MSFMHNYSNKQLEKISIADLEKMLIAATNKRVQPEIPTNDKEPLWDGYIYIYSQEASESNDYLKTRLPIQVKATNVSKFSNKFHPYSVSKTALNAYLNEGGIIYFVIEVKENADGLPETKIFYKVLTTVALKNILDTFSENGKQKSIHIDRILTVKDNFLRQCDYLDKSRKFISIDSTNNMIPLEKIKNKPITILSANGDDDILKGDFIAYYTDNNNIKLPINMNLNYTEISYPENKIIHIDNKRYIDNIMRTKDSKGNEYITFGDSIKLDFNKKVVTVEKSNSHIIDRYNTLDFFLNKLTSQNSKIGKTERHKMDILKEEKEFLSDILNVCKNFNIDAHTIKLKDFTESDYNAIDILVNVENSKVSAKNVYKIEPCVITFLNYKIALLKFTYENKFTYYNYYDTNLDFVLVHKYNEKEEILSRFSTIDEDILTAHNFNYNLTLSTFLPITESNSDTAPIYYNEVLLNLIKAWDINSNNSYIKIIRHLEKILEQFIDKDIQIVNSAQIEYRLNNNKLTQETKDKLYKIKFNPKTNDYIKCGISILIEDYEGFETHFKNLSLEDRTQFESFPIYNLYKNHNL